MRGSTTQLALVRDWDLSIRDGGACLPPKSHAMWELAESSLRKTPKN